MNEAKSEQELVENVQLGHVNDYRGLVEMHVSAIRKYLAVFAPSMRMVDELAHETFVFAFHNIHQFKPGTSFRAWLRAIAWNLLRAELKRSKLEAQNKQNLEQHLAAFGLENCAADPVPLLYETLEHCLERLPGQMRVLLSLKYRRGESTKEISATLEKSSDWVRTNLCRVRTILRECVERKAGKEAMP